MWDFLDAIKGSDVIEGINTRGETTVEAEDLIIDKGSEGKIVEKVGKIFPDIRIAVLAKTFIVEAVDLGDLARFVVAAEYCNALRVSDFESNQ